MNRSDQRKMRALPPRNAIDVASSSKAASRWPMKTWWVPEYDLRHHREHRMSSVSVYVSGRGDVFRIWPDINEARPLTRRAAGGLEDLRALDPLRLVMLCG